MVEPTGAGVRVDSGITDGTEVTSLYDPMLMKVIAHGADRAEALARLDQALAGTVIAGVRVNTDFCRFLINVPEVIEGDLDTGLLDRVVDDYRGPGVSDDALVAAAMVWLARRWPDNPGSAWEIPDAWRSGRTESQRLRLAGDAGSSLISITGVPESAEVVVHDRVAGLSGEADPAQREPKTVTASVHRDGPAWRVTIDGLTRRWQVDLIGTGPFAEMLVVSEDGTWVLRRDHVARSEADRDAGGDGSLSSPMPGTVTTLSVADGTLVSAGDAVLVVEAMKMEHVLRAAEDGTVTFHCTAGGQVPAGKPLATIAPVGAN